MVASALRKELQGYIEVMSERRLKVLKPLLLELVEECVLEPATEEEGLRIEERVKEYRENPSSFGTWDML